MQWLAPHQATEVKHSDLPRLIIKPYFAAKMAITETVDECKSVYNILFSSLIANLYRNLIMDRNFFCICHSLNFRGVLHGCNREMRAYSYAYADHCKEEVSQLLINWIESVFDVFGTDLSEVVLISSSDSESDIRRAIHILCANLREWCIILLINRAFIDLFVSQLD